MSYLVLATAGRICGVESEDDERMRYLRVPLVLMALAVVVGGCGSGSTRMAVADAQVESGSCQSSGAGGRVVSQSCSFVLSDGQQFRCQKAFRGQTPTARVLEHTKEVRQVALAGALPGRAQDDRGA
jgi:hypothetical protein